MFHVPNRGYQIRQRSFGDTVNTASRMESTGLPGKIQISQATAERLQERDKGHWLVPRPDKIQAKGKGEMQTYFVNLNEGSATTKLSTTSGDDLTDPMLAEDVGENLGAIVEEAEELKLERQLTNYMCKKERRVPSI